MLLSWAAAGGLADGGGGCRSAVRCERRRVDGDGRWLMERSRATCAIAGGGGRMGGRGAEGFSLDRLVRVNITNQYTGYSLIQVGQCMIFFNFRLMVPVRAAC